MIDGREQEDADAAWRRGGECCRSVEESESRVGEKEKGGGKESRGERVVGGRRKETRRGDSSLIRKSGRAGGGVPVFPAPPSPRCRPESTKTYRKTKQEMGRFA